MVRLHSLYGKITLIMSAVNCVVCHVSSMGRALAFRADGQGSNPGPAWQDIYSVHGEPPLKKNIYIW